MKNFFKSLHKFHHNFVVIPDVCNFAKVANVKKLLC